MNYNDTLILAESIGEHFLLILISTDYYFVRNHGHLKIFHIADNAHKREFLLRACSRLAKVGAKAEKIKTISKKIKKTRMHSSRIRNPLQ